MAVGSKSSAARDDDCCTLAGQVSPTTGNTAIALRSGRVGWYSKQPRQPGTRFAVLRYLRGTQSRGIISREQRSESL
jgi:hypothetical protein